MTKESEPVPAPRSSWRRVLFAVTASLSVTAAVLLPTPAGAAHSWGGYHWGRSANPFPLTLGNNVTAAWTGYLGGTSADWSGSGVVKTTVATGASNPKNCRPTAGRVEVCNAKYGATGWLGLGSIWLSGNHITQGTAKMNDTYFTTARYNTPAWRNMVMCQEVGHTLGLAHVNETYDTPNVGSCMDYTNNPAGTPSNDPAGSPSNERPNSDDFAELLKVYGHPDATTTTATVTPNSAPADSGNGRADWGRPIAKDAKGRADRFVRDDGNGGQILTFVIWAD